MSDIIAELWASDEPVGDFPAPGTLRADFVDVDARTIKGLIPNFSNLLDLAPGGYAAGGCFKNIFNHEVPRDIDVFFWSVNDFEVALKNFEAKYEKVYENDNAICFKVGNQNVELVQSQVGTVQQMLDRFDFTLVKFAVYLDADGEMRARYHEKFFEHLMQRKLVLTDTAILPVNTFERALKYSRYGYNMCLESKQILIESIRSSAGGTLAQDFYVGID